MRVATTNFTRPVMSAPSGNYLEAPALLQGDGFLVNQWVYLTQVYKQTPFALGRPGMLSHHRRTIIDTQNRFLVGSFYNPTGEPGESGYDSSKDHNGGQAICAGALPLHVWVPTAAAWIGPSERRGWWDAGHEAVNTALSLPRPPLGTRIGCRMDSAEGLLPTQATADLSIWDITGLLLDDLRALVVMLHTPVAGLAPNPQAVNAMAASWHGRLVQHVPLDRTAADFGVPFTPVGTLSAFSSYPPVAESTEPPDPPPPADLLDQTITVTTPGAYRVRITSASPLMDLSVALDAGTYRVQVTPD